MGKSEFIETKKNAQKQDWSNIAGSLNQQLINDQILDLQIFFILSILPSTILKNEFQKDMIFELMNDVFTMYKMNFDLRHRALKTLIHMMQYQRKFVKPKLKLILSWSSTILKEYLGSIKVQTKKFVEVINKLMFVKKATAMFKKLGLAHHENNRQILKKVKKSKQSSNQDQYVSYHKRFHVTLFEDIAKLYVMMLKYPNDCILWLPILEKNDQYELSHQGMIGK